MYLRLLQLELKNFFRNPQFGANLAMKILIFISYGWLCISLLSVSVLFYYYVDEKLQLDPLRVFARLFIYFWIVDLVLRYIMQQMPTQNIKPFLSLNITKKKLVNYTIIKTFFSFFNWTSLLLLLPFGAMLLLNGHLSFIGVAMFVLGILFMFYFNNFLNILLNGKTIVVVGVFGIIAVMGALE